MAGCLGIRHARSMISDAFKSMPIFWGHLILFLLLFGVSLPGWANDIEVRLESANGSGQDPTLVVDVRKALESARLNVRAKDAYFQKQHGKAKAGAQIRFALPHRAQGQMDWSGSLEVRFSDGSQGAMDLNFTTQILAPLRLDVQGDRKDIVERHQVRIVVGEGAEFVRLEVYGEAGQRLAAVELDDDKFTKNNLFAIPFSPHDSSPIVRVRVQAGDSQGRSITHEVYPWELQIPHEEVIFASGKAAILPNEAPKLERALLELRAASTRYQKALSITQQSVRLFISGHTDTVGSQNMNQRLSDERARAIAQWFRSAGVALPIFYRGWGESRLRIETADEVDQAENRRADYVLAIEPPAGGLTQWKAVP